MVRMQKTIGACLAERARITPHQTAVRNDVSWCTWQELDRLSDYMAYRMISIGVQKGSHAGIWSVNSLNWIVVYLALVKLGAVPVLINTCYREEELMRVMAYADVEFMYYGDVYKDIFYSDVIEQVQKHSSCKVRKWVSIGKDWNGPCFTEDSFCRCEKTKRAMREVEARKLEVMPEDIAGMLFTSGTTSGSKGVLLSHNNLLMSAGATVRAMRWTMQDKFCIAVPLFHCFGLTSCLLSSILTGAEMNLLPFYRTKDVLSCIGSYGSTVLNGVPSMFLAMLRNAQFAGSNLSSLRSGIIAGSPFTVEEYLSICREIPNLQLIPSYGQTETSPAVTFALYEDSSQKRAQSSGKAVEDVEIMIADPESHKELPARRTGEIMVRGYNVMQGYYRMPEETSRAVTEDGWLHTGDLGYLDEDKYLYVTDRVKEIIIRSGENISPREIEDCLRQILWLEQVKVVGIPAEVIQEEIVACVILKPGKNLQEEEIRKILKKRLAHYKIPSRFVVFEAFPLSASGKVSTAELKKQVTEYLKQKENARRSE